MAKASFLQQAISSTLPTVVDSVEVRSRYSPPFTLKIADLLKEGPPSPLMVQLKPTIILRGSIGQQVIAPGGAADPNEWRGNLTRVALIAAGVGGLLAILVWRWLKK